MMTLDTDITASIIPTVVSSSIDPTVNTVIIRNYSKFSPSEGIVAGVMLFNSSSQLVKTAQIPITGSLWQNWPANQTAEQDNQYIMNIVLNTLGFTAA
jgi:hypothetical protein